MVNYYYLVALMTEKVLNLVRHFTIHKKDKHSKRGFEVSYFLNNYNMSLNLFYFQMLISRRRGMLKYLKLKDINMFKETVVELGLQKEAANI